MCSCWLGHVSLMSSSFCPCFVWEGSPAEKTIENLMVMIGIVLVLMETIMLSTGTGILLVGSLKRTLLKEKNRNHHGNSNGLH